MSHGNEMVTSKTLTIESVNPANKEVLGEFPVMSESQVKVSSAATLETLA